MSTRTPDAMTFVPRRDEAERLTLLLAQLAPSNSEDRAALVDPAGNQIDLPEDVFEALLAVVRAMAHGEGISVIPRSVLLTTQQAADMLSISRPTLVRLLESGEIAFERRGRHRRVKLADLLNYQGLTRKERSGKLDSLAQEGQSAAAYERTSAPPPLTR